MAKISDPAVEEVRQALRRYVAEVEASPLKQSSKWNFVLHAENFVRWLEDSFNPGSRLQ